MGQIGYVKYRIPDVFRRSNRTLQRSSDKNENKFNCDISLAAVAGQLSVSISYRF